jgi:hypothetical protein
MVEIVWILAGKMVKFPDGTGAPDPTVYMRMARVVVSWTKM